jgi:hypothetical protein
MLVSLQYAIGLPFSLELGSPGFPWGSQDFAVDPGILRPAWVPCPSLGVGLMARRSGALVTEMLTNKVIDRLMAEADPDGDTLVWDEKVPGLILRLRHGLASFVFQYKHHGKTRRPSLGQAGALTLDEARKRARLLYVEVQSGGDPSAAKRESRRKRPTFGEAAEMYLEDLWERAAAGAKRGKLSTAAEFGRLLRRVIVPAIGGREVESLALAPAAQGSWLIESGLHDAMVGGQIEYATAA